jgi:hypothetical protein
MRSGGDGTVFDTATRFHPRATFARSTARRSSSATFFNQNWVVAPASVAARDGLGRCSTRGPVPVATSRTVAAVAEPGEPMERCCSASASQAPTPTALRRRAQYGDQIQDSRFSVREADVFVQDEMPGRLATIVFSFASRH